MGRTSASSREPVGCARAVLYPPIYLFSLCSTFTDLLAKQLTRGNLIPHKKCKKLSITNLQFADDAIIFCDSSKSSARAVTRVLEVFYQDTGLKINKDKSQVFFSTFSNPDLQTKLMSILGIQRGSMSFRYLGVPITSRQIKARDCMSLIEKNHNLSLCQRAKSLSYAGRVELIKSMCYGNINFWCSVIKLPPRVISKLNLTLANFLWSRGHRRGLAKVAWTNVTKPMAFGGLGLRDIEKLNQVFLMRHIWNIVQDKNSLWVKWIHEKYLHSDSIWSIQFPRNAPWPMRSLLSARDTCMQMVGYKIANGNSIRFWLDPCFESKILLVLVNDTRFEKPSGKDMRLNSLISNNIWSIPTPRSPRLMDIYAAIPQVPIHSTLSSNQLYWKRTNNGKFTIKSAYEGLVHGFEVV